MPCQECRVKFHALRRDAGSPPCRGGQGEQLALLSVLESQVAVQLLLTTVANVWTHNVQIAVSEQNQIGAACSGESISRHQAHNWLVSGLSRSHNILLACGTDCLMATSSPTSHLTPAMLNV